MSHINTLEVYKEYIGAGFSPEESTRMTRILENSFMTKVNELKNDFASQKFISILGTLILFVGISTVGLMWRLSVDMEVLKHDVQELKIQK